MMHGSTSRSHLILSLDKRLALELLPPFLMVACSLMDLPRWLALRCTSSSNRHIIAGVRRRTSSATSRDSRAIARADRTREPAGTRAQAPRRSSARRGARESRERRFSRSRPGVSMAYVGTTGFLDSRLLFISPRRKVCAGLWSCGPPAYRVPISPRPPVFSRVHIKP